MKCPDCGKMQSSAQDHVLETRRRADGDYIRRRRQCGNCGARFSTREYTVLDLKEQLKIRDSFLKNELALKVDYAIEDLIVARENLNALENIMRGYLKND